MSSQTGHNSGLGASENERDGGSMSSSEEEVEVEELLTIGTPPIAYRYSPQQHAKFIEWWLAAPWALRRLAGNNPPDLEKQINWKNTGRRAEIWKKFRLGAYMDTANRSEDRGKPIVICKSCGSMLEHPSSRKVAHGTSTLTQHVRTRSCVRVNAQSSLRQRTLHDQPRARQLGPLEKEEFYDLVLSTVISQRWSFRSVENQEWRALATRQNPLFPLPCAATLQRRLEGRVTAFEDSALAGLVPGSKLALSLDCWSSTTRLGYIAIVAYFIDKDWKHNEVLIGFEHLESVHTGVELAKVINKVIDKYGLAGRVVSITTDNASNNGTMIEELNKLLKEAIKSGRLLDGKVHHIPCLAHVLQLALKDMLGTIRICPKNEFFERNYEAEKDLDELEKIAVESNRGIPYVLAKLRKIVVFSGSSSQRRHQFALAQAPSIADPQHPQKQVLLLPLDVKTRFDSTCGMILRAQRLKDSIDRFTRDCREATMFSLSLNEWRLLGYLLDLTRPIAFMTACVGGTRGVSVHLGFRVYDYLFENFFEARRRLIEKRGKHLWIEPLIKALEAAEDKLEKYFIKLYGDQGSVYAIAAILDPQNKLRGFNPDYCWLSPESMQNLNWMDTYQAQIEKLFREDYQPTASQTNIERVETLQNTDRSVFTLALNIWRIGAQSQSRQENSAASQGGVSSTAELDAYLAESPDKREILVYWRDKESQFPNLANMARDFLCIPLAGLGVERVFNFSREICSFRRGRLSPSTIRALVLLYFSIVHDRRLDRINDARAALLGTFDTSDWDDQDFEDAISELEKEITDKEVASNAHSLPQYISDEDDGEEGGPRTEYNRDIARRRRRVEATRRQAQREERLNEARRNGRPILGNIVNEEETQIRDRLLRERNANRSPTNWDPPSSPPLPTPSRVVSQISDLEIGGLIAEDSLPTLPRSRKNPPPRATSSQSQHLQSRPKKISKVYSRSGSGSTGLSRTPAKQNALRVIERHLEGR